MEQEVKKSKLRIIVPIIIAVVVVAVVAIVWITSNNTGVSRVSSTYAQDIKNLCLIDLKSRLRDPNSLQEYASYAYYKNDELKYIVIDAGSKNGFGGMVRNNFVYTVGGSYIGTEENSTAKAILNDNTYTKLSTSTDYDKYKKDKQKEDKKVKDTEKTLDYYLDKVNKILDEED